MKITVDVECTPEEARRVMGLPDLTPLHDAYLSRMRVAIEQGVTPDMVNTMIQNWTPMGDAGLAMWRKMIEGMGGGER